MITLKPNPAGQSLKMPWRNCIAVGRAYELLRTDLLEHLRYAQRELGFRYCRFHGIFHDDMAVVVEQPDGSMAYQWHHVDKVYDALLEIGLRPFVELNPMPKALASGAETIFHWKMNVTPPRSYELWGDLVEAFVRHLLDRYGREEVQQWYFEVWNEPNLPGFWAGSQQDYWRLYDMAATTIKRIDSPLRVGGPATSKGQWVEDMIAHCVDENIPLDFISTHVYPQDEYVNYADRKGSPHAPGEFFADTFRRIQQHVKNSARPDLEIHWTEWNPISTKSTAEVTWIDSPSVDSLFAASFIVRNCLALDRACDTMCYWTVSDIFEESGMPHSPFSCTYGLLTIHGIPKASFHAFRLLRRMQGRLMDAQIDASAPDGCGLCAAVEGDVTRILLWNYQWPEIIKQPTWVGSLRVPVADNDQRLLLSTRIKAGAGSAWETWCQIGRPHNLSRGEEELLRAHAQPECQAQILDATGALRDIEFTLAPAEVLYLEIRPKTHRSLPKGASKADLHRWNLAMGELSR